MDRLKELWGVTVRYLKEVRGELRKTVWPDGKQTYALTTVVVLVSVVVSGLIAIFDWGMSAGVNFLLHSTGY